ncbi:hypothetical protein JHK85_021193 [Glycine max]|uniref:Uncharacterized protein n=1 Tax=Glycine max TaxID=3847 RepID=A0A0R0IIL9_SOYBN|nr:hypothetical protein JHK85_021193 [Glycine max]KAG5024845.1 hypothetical protein JHK86_020759 [Glycine max]
MSQPFGFRGTSITKASYTYPIQEPKRRLSNPWMRSHYKEAVPIHHHRTFSSLFHKPWPHLSLHAKSSPPRTQFRFPNRRSKPRSNSSNSAAEILRKITTAAATAAATAWCKGNHPNRARLIPAAMFRPSQLPLRWSPKMKALRERIRGIVVLKICIALQLLW